MIRPVPPSLPSPKTALPLRGSGVSILMRCCIRMVRLVSAVPVQANEHAPVKVLLLLVRGLMHRIQAVICRFALGSS